MSPSPICVPDFRRGIGHDGVRQRRCNAQCFGRRIQHGGQAGAAFVVLFFAQGPRLVFDDVFVDRGDQSPRGFERARKLELIEERAELLDRPVSCDDDRIIAWRPRGRASGKALRL